MNLPSPSHSVAQKWPPQEVQDSMCDIQLKNPTQVFFNNLSHALYLEVRRWNRSKKVFQASLLRPRNLSPTTKCYCWRNKSQYSTRYTQHNPRSLQMQFAAWTCYILRKWCKAMYMLRDWLFTWIYEVESVGSCRVCTVGVSNSTDRSGRLNQTASWSAHSASTSWTRKKLCCEKFAIEVCIFLGSPTIHASGSVGGPLS